MTPQRDRKPALRRALTALALALSVTQAPGEPADETSALEGTEWQLEQYRVESEMQEAVGPRGNAVLRLEAGRLSGSTGCNRVMGAYRLDGDRLSFESRSATTMMACPPPLMAQEQAVLAAFEQAANFGIEEGRLRIADDDGRTLLVLSEYRPVPLLGTDWRLTWYNNGRQAIVTVLQGTDTLLRLHDDGRLEGKACNNYRGTFEVEGDQLRATGPIASTRMACRGPEGADQQEAAYLSALERVAGYRISGDELTLVDDRGSTLARFQAASANAD